MKKKGNFRKVGSGLLAGMKILSTVLSPMTAYAAEIQQEEKPPLYEEVKDLLDEDEVVAAKDYEIETGSVFDVKSDYTGLEIKDDDKVKVTFEEAKNDKNEDFTTDHADTYKAVYYVEPVNQEHPKYQISRKLIVREKATEAQTETAGSEAVTESETAGSEQQTEEAEDSSDSEGETDADSEEADNPEIEEGYTTELEGCTKVVSWCKNGDNNIYGQFYYPADFDETKTYPVIIMSHGIGSTSQLVERAKWPEKAAQDGYVVYTFDFCGGSLNGNSDVDFMDMTVMTEKEDLSAVIDFVKTKDYVDQDHLFLLGQSQGGLISTLAAADRKEDVAAMLLVYPAFCIPDNARELYATADDIPEGEAEMPVGTVGSEYVKTVYALDVYDTISAYEGDVMIIHGINDSLVPYSYSEKAIEEAYTGEGSVLIPIYGKKSTHGFEMNFEEGRDYAETVGLEFLDVHLKEEE